jgi:hypothetical protein
VCLITLAVISPGLAVFNLVWEQRQELLAIKNTEIYKNSTNECSNEKQFQEMYHDNSMRGLSNDTFMEEIVSKTQLPLIGNIIQWLFLFLPICIGITIMLYDRYLIYRASIFRQKVEILEKLWQKNID